ncbi:MAG: PQQ-binding-like beta-propeller repeat protein, partial [Planctomycetota bacterium JB042]
MRQILLHGVRAALVAVPLSFPAAAQDWPHWRGPNFDGSTRAAGLPAEFDRENGVRWRAPLPGPGAGTPIVLGDRVFLPSLDVEHETLVALCLDRRTGEVEWSRTVGGDYLPEGAGKLRLHQRSNYASPSPVTDGEVVVFFYGSGDLAAFALDGEPLWSRNLQRDLGDFAFQWTFSASPTLFEGRLYLPVLQRNEPANGYGKPGAESFLLQLDPRTGETLVRHVRPSDARMESLESYATMIPFVAEDGRKELLVVGGDVVTGHDPETLKELWRWGTWNEGHREIWWRVVPSPVVGDGVVLVCAPKRAPVFAVRLGGEGDLGEDGLVWKSEGKRNPVSSDVPTPLFLDGAFFVLSDVRSALSRVDPATGEVAWTTELPGRALWRASPTGADGRVYCLDHAGTLVEIGR